jgi:bifunctional non-homologous end joining protein LigD
LKRGELKFSLDGQKLHGGFVLIRSGPGGEKRWFLIKRKDEWANRTWKIDHYPQSVLTQEKTAPSTQQAASSRKRRTAA